MSRPIRKIAAVCALVAFAAPAALALPGSGPLVARVSVADCSRGTEAQHRFVTFRGAMSQVPGADTMGMRFVLEERRGDQRFQRVDAPGLGVWQKSMSGVKRFVYRQQVVALAEGSEYRARVRFRWYDTAGGVVRQTARRSRGCRQPGELANLQVVRIRSRPVAGSPGVARYAVEVVNRGGAAAPGVTVELAVDQATVDSAIAGGLEPGEVRMVFVNGPECVTSVRAEADPADTVAESDESDNALDTTCPPAR